jgi:hypothetical protein
MIGFIGHLHNAWLHLTNHSHTDQCSQSNGGRPSASGLSPRRLVTISHQPHYSLTADSRTPFPRFLYCCDHVTGVGHCLAIGMFAEPFPSNGRLSGSAILPFRRHVTIPTHRTTQCHSPEQHSLNNHLCKNFRTCITTLLLSVKATSHSSSRPTG